MNTGENPGSGLPPRARSVITMVLLGAGIGSAFGLMSLSGRAAEVDGTATASVVLTNVHQVLDLGAYRARNASQPVHLRGTVVQQNRKPGVIFLHDGTGCIYVTVTNFPAELEPGKIVEAEGWTEAGIYAPMVYRAGVRVVGEGPLPEGMHLPVARMRAGDGCWQWVRVEGVVRDMNRDVPNLAISIAAQNQRFTGFIFGYEQFKGRGLPLDWLEARVVLEGICWTDINDRNQAVDFHVMMMHTNQIRFLRAGTTNLFGPGGLPQADARRVRQPSDDRVQLSGTVLALLSDGRLFLRTDLGPIQARLSAPISRGMPTTELVPRAPPEPLALGDRVELVGAPAESKFSPLLVDAEYRRVGKQAIPVAIASSGRDLIQGRHDSDLVRVVGRLLAQQRRPQGLDREETLVLQAGDTVFEAAWLGDATKGLPNLPINSRVEVSGICLVHPGPGDLLRSCKVLLPDPARVRYLGQAHFWSQPGVSRVLGIGAALTIAGGLWVFLLRRQVRERTGALAAANRNLLHEAQEREKAQADLKRSLAVERELGELKSRFVSLVSHEFRTPLGITMSAVELLRNYLHRLPPRKMNELLEDIYASTLRMSGLMEQVLLLGRFEAGKLTARLEPLDVRALTGKLVDETLSASNHKCPIELTLEEPVEEVEGDEGLLRHILSNLLSNAVKYSPEGRGVQFKVCRRGSELVFVVKDDGIGIPEADRAHLFEAFHRASNVGQTPGTGLGLLIVKRCVELVGGRIVVDSQEGVGTTFTVSMPLLVAQGLVERGDG